jgi:uncharacterized protein (TIGR02421 family)
MYGESPQPAMPPIARHVDEALIRLDRQIDWLTHVSPVGNEELWHAFVESGYTEEPRLRYRPPREDLGDLREALWALPANEVEEPALEALLCEKQRELDRQIELVSLRNTDGFVPASIDLFGDADPDLIRTAQHILDTIEREEGHALSAGAEDVALAAEAEFERFRSIDPGFSSSINIVDDLNSGLLVNHGQLYIARALKIRPEAVAPLVAHEVGTHVLTYHNGRCQPLRQLEAGLAHYDPLQEGLGTFSEYLTGYLPPKRLRILAARVIAADLAIRGDTIVAIFERLFEEEGLLADDAFDTAVRAKRGGGLTKDAVYLRGLRNLLAYLSSGAEFEFLLLGKFAMRQRHVIRRLLDEGWLQPPVLLPSHLENSQALRRLDRARKLTVDQLFQRTPGS